MSVEIVLSFIILALLAFIGWKERETRLLNNKLINALLAKNASEMVNMDMADKAEIKVQQPQEPDLVPMDQLTDKEYTEAING